MRLFFLALLSVATLGFGPAASAQALPDSIRATGVSVQQWQAVQAEVRRAAAARGASERALAAVAARVSVNLVQNGHIDLDRLLASIDERAQQVAELQTQLAAMQHADDPAVAQLLSDAHAAIDAGDLDRGDALLAQAAESDLAGIARDQARLSSRQTRAAQTIGERGRLAFVAADYLGAATLYAHAAETAPESDVRARWDYRMYEANALKTRGALFGEPGPLREAVRLYRDVALPLAPRETRADDWSATQNDMGDTLRTLGALGDDQALRDAVAAFRAALTVDTRERAPAHWAMDQSNLGNALETLGERGDEQAMRDAVAAYRAALDVRTREADPKGWATDQNNLGNALRVLGQRGDEQALRDAITAFRAALSVDTRETDAASWARDQNNLGNALNVAGRHGDDQELRESVAAFRAALSVVTRESAPSVWAGRQNNLGGTLLILGRRGDAQALRDAAAAFRAALTVDTRERAPYAWARDQFNLALALQAQAQRGEALEAARAALEGYQQAGDTYWVEQTRRLITTLEAM